MTRTDTTQATGQPLTTREQAERALIELGQWIDQRHWCPATGGNFSHRLPDGNALITRSGCQKGALQTPDLLCVSLEGELLPSASSEPASGKPSAETLLHTAIYELDPQAQVVLHTHSVNSTVLSRATPEDWLTLTGYEMQKSLTGNTSHTQSIRLAILDNDQDMPRLANVLRKRWTQTPLNWGFLVRGHGLYSWGETPEKARQHLEGLEFLFACALEMKKLGL